MSQTFTVGDRVVIHRPSDLSLQGRAGTVGDAVYGGVVVQFGDDPPRTIAAPRLRKLDPWPDRVGFEQFITYCSARGWSWNLDYTPISEWRGPKGDRELVPLGWRYTATVANDHGSVDIMGERLDEAMARVLVRMDAWVKGVWNDD